MGVYLLADCGSRCAHPLKAYNLWDSPMCDDLLDLVWTQGRERDLKSRKAGQLPTLLESNTAGECRKRCCIRISVEKCSRFPSNVPAWLSAMPCTIHTHHGGTRRCHAHSAARDG